MSTEADTQAGEEKLTFQAEVSRLLDIVAHSLYSDRRVFLRELISNASDACDRLRYLAIENPELTLGDPDFRITFAIDKTARTLTIADNGIGMNRDELVENLGTIARSGTSAFLKNLSGDARKDMSLIGQFGVGFYSAFMVADRVEVVSRRAGDTHAWRWSSDGKGTYAIAATEAQGRGTAVTLHMREDADEFLDGDTLREIVRRYSDHIAIPIKLGGDKGETLNSASALWTRSKNEVTADQHREFYRHIAHQGDEPWLTLHWRAEGKIEYQGLLYIPSSRPYDLFMPERHHGVKLYVRRVFITDRCDELVPGWLRFLRGVVDSQDLPLNISREMLQNNPVLSLIRSGIVTRVCNELEKKAKDDPAEYAKFWDNFGSVLKEGLYEEIGHRDALLNLARFRSTGAEGQVSLADYVGRMKEGQDAIFTIAGEDAAALAKSPQLEGFRKRGVEVLLLTDPIDEFWITRVGAFQGKAFKSVTRGAADLSKIKAAEGEADKKDEAADAPDSAALIALFRLALDKEVKDVRASDRLTDSAVCLVADEHDLDIHLERMLRQHKQVDAASKRILEINPTHPLMRKLAADLARAGADAGVQPRLNEIAHLLLDQARIVEGERLADPAGFAKRLANVLAGGAA